MQQITKSTVNWEQHKKDIHTKMLNRFGKRKADKFINRYSNVYDKYGRSYIDYHLAWALMEDYEKVSKLGTIVYAFVGTRGTGKSTLMKNVLHYLDPTINPERLSTDIDEIFGILQRLPVTNSLKAVGLDEPDDKYHSSSKEAGFIKKIIGKWRQQQLFFGICATDLQHIPTYIYNQVDVIFFLPFHGQVHMFRDRPKKRSYVVRTIKNKYNREDGYNIFFKLPKQYRRKMLEKTGKDRTLPGFRIFNTYEKSPYDIKYGQEYLKAKANDYAKDLDSFNKNVRGITNKQELLEKDLLVRTIVRLYENKKSERKVAELTGLSKTSVHHYLEKWKNCSDGQGL